jgi:hypothetical protein
VTYYNRPGCGGCPHQFTWELGPDTHDACRVIVEAHENPSTLSREVVEWGAAHQTDPNPPLCPGRADAVDAVCAHGVLLGDSCLSCRAEAEDDARYDAYKEGD